MATRWELELELEQEAKAGMALWEEPTVQAVIPPPVVHLLPVAEACQQEEAVRTDQRLVVPVLALADMAIPLEAQLVLQLVLLLQHLPLLTPACALNEASSIV